jgi:predicted CXXCH cytochrome family protein
LKKTVSTAFCISILIVCSLAFAGSGPDVINMKNSVTFPHWKHQILNASECSNCHKADGGKIAGWGKDKAHELCISCHDLNDKGPVVCNQCHK